MCTVENCTNTRIKARGLCSTHYEKHRTSSDFSSPSYSPYPEDASLVALFAEHQSYSAVARALGKSRKSLSDYLSRRPELEADCRTHLRPRLSPEQRKANDYAAKRAYRINNPDKVKEHKRKWAGSRDPEVVRKWNRHNAERRKQSLTAFELTSEEKLLSFEYEQVLKNDPCSYCGAPPRSTIDHIQPIFGGGSDRWENKTAACWNCNSSKRDKDLLQFLLWKRERSWTKTTTK